jgi:tetratricopeptide (TPR) repeat protein/CHAT domain-containing protein
MLPLSIACLGAEVGEVSAGCLWRVIVLIGILVAGFGSPVHAQGSDELALEKQVTRLYQEGKYKQAARIAERFVALTRKKHRENSKEYSTAIAWLANVYLAERRFAEAEPLYKRALAIREKALGPDHLDVGATLNNFAELYRAQARYAEAEPLYRRALAIREKALGPGHPVVGASLYNLALLYQDQGRLAEAEPLYKRALAIDENALGPEHLEVATDLNTLALLYRAQARYAEAEPLYKRALAIGEKGLGPDHLDVGATLNNLAELYRAETRYAEAEPLHKRALAIREKALGPGHPVVGASLNNLALLYQAQGRLAEAEPLYKRALAIDENALGPEHLEVATNLNNLARFYYWQGRFAEAEPLYRRALAIDEKALGPEHPFLGTLLDNFGRLLLAEGNTKEAEELLKRSLAMAERVLGPDHPDVAEPLYMLGWVALAQSNWLGAAEYWRRAKKLIEDRAERGLGGSERETAKSETVRLGWYFSHLVRLTYRLVDQGHADREKAGREMFETAQWAQGSEAASSLAQMAARSAKGTTALAGLVRERQDLIAEWQTKDKQLIAAKSKQPAERNPEAERLLSGRLAAIDARLPAIDARLAKDFPDYASFASSKPISVDTVQTELRDDEALILFLDTPEIKLAAVPEESFIWAVTKTDMRWVKSELGTKALTEYVTALRCGLDAALWDDEPAAARCRDLVKGAPERDTFGNVRPETLPFDSNRAYALYKALLGPIADVIKGKQLLIVPSGALTQMPFQVLITDKPDPAVSGTEALRRGQWLVRSHALTVLPSVTSLKVLRQLAKESHATRTLIGFGNPLLDGPDAGTAAWAAAARSRTSCARLKEQRVADLAGERRGVPPLKLRSGLADVLEIRSQMPLPETADELCAVAHDLGVSDKDIWLGNRAGEAEIKRLSEAGELAKYRIIHFATHGALAGQLGGNSEPGLVLTPPATATERDDGYLSASEIAQLKLDADWVILSACNTAAGNAEGAEALSGLARAFFYAGAHALLVSHWAVASDATVKLITGAVGTMASDKTIGRAEAMRQSMLALVDKGDAYEAHPAYWAPFVVVGEGGAGR